MSRRIELPSPVAVAWLVAVTLFATIALRAQAQTLDPAPKGSFSIVMISDTQGYLGRGTHLQPNSDLETANPVFDAETKWILGNIHSQHIVFVTHGGDITDVNNPIQWRLAQHYIDRLQGVVPYGLVVGNHDMTHDGNSSLFQKYFPASRFQDFSWYGGYFKGQEGHPEISGNNANSYQLFSAGGVNFVILHLECNAPDNVLRWADSVLDRYKSRFAIVTTHMFLGPLHEESNKEKGVMQWSKVHGDLGNTPQQMWDKCFKKHENLQLILNGDQSQSNAMYLPLTGDHGNVVHALLTDYSANDHGHIVHSLSDYNTGKHGGAIRIYRFLPSENQIQVITYDSIDDNVITATEKMPDEKQHNFTISIKLSGWSK